MKTVLSILVILFLVFGCVQAPKQISVEEPQVRTTKTLELEVTPTELIPEKHHDFVQASGRDLVLGDDNTPFYLRGINFSNYIWNHNHEQLMSVKHHRKEDYLKVAEMGMNVVRLNLSTYHFESDDAPYTYLDSGWLWLDQEIEWAREAGVYLILNIHFAPGMSADTDIDFWKETENQKRVVEVWREIAKRYVDEPVIAGFDLFNEPEPPNEQAWKDFVTEMVDAIRESDENHLIILEAILGIRDADGNWLAVENPFFPLEDDNVMFDFHFYLPFEFTHQKMEWAGITATYQYPNERVFFDWDHMEWVENLPGETLPSGTTDWAYYSSEIFKVENPDVVLAKPNPFCNGLENGTAFFSDFIITAYESDGTFIEKVVHGYVEDDQTWWFWSEDGSGELNRSSDVPVEENVLSSQSIMLTGSKKNSTVANADFGFVVNPEYHYSIDGWIKGDNIPPYASCHYVIELFTMSEGEPVIRENRDYLEKEILELAAYAREANVPINIGELGVNWYGWLEDRGADRWYQDMFSILVEQGISFQTWAYHDIFGIYTAWDTFPADHQDEHINYEMLNALTELFSGLNGPGK